MQRQDTNTSGGTTNSTGRRGVRLKVALVGAGVAAGAIAATALGANAATSAGSGSTAVAGYGSSVPGTAPGPSAGGAPANGTVPSGAPANGPAPGGAPADRHGSAPARSDEKAVDSATAAKIRAAALKAVPGGTVYRVETDSGDAAYEAHMTKSDGTDVTVKFDKNLAVTGTESGMGR